MIRKIAKGIGIFFVAVLTVMVVGVGASGVARVQARQLAEPTGASAVGRIGLALTDAARVDPFASDGRPREIAVWIWYPAAKGSSAVTAPYLPKTWADASNNVNGPASVVISGTVEGVAAVRAALEADLLQSRPLVAAHHPAAMTRAESSGG